MRCLRFARFCVCEHARNSSSCGQLSVIFYKSIVFLDKENVKVMRTTRIEIRILHSKYVHRTW